jgi:Zn-dependent M28 family amino/carboxypeptidase
MPVIPIRYRAAAAALAAAFLAGCAAGHPPSATDAELASAGSAITEQSLLAHIGTLASDEFEGRAPGTRGEELTVAYLIEQFEALGLEPGNPDGTWVQEVPLVSYTAQPTTSFQVGGQTLRLSWPEDYVAVSRRFEPELRLSSELVFVGYGVVAPEYDWDDFKDVDVAGKTLVILVNDPQVVDPADPARLDESVFRGRAMTYYGRWTYKYEEAVRQGAAAAIIVHETGPAGYPFEVIRGSRSGENFDIAGPAEERLQVEAWIDEPTARRLMAAAGQDFDALKAAAATREFHPVPLGGTAEFDLRTTSREIRSHNVIARRPGSDPARAGEHIVYTAHWDHLGVQDGEIYNGAIDNASGTASMLEIARAFAHLPQGPARSVLFLAVTAEERGLLGAKHYAANPLWPLETTLANINVDGINQWGRTEDIVLVGMGNTTLDDVLRAAAQRQGRTVEADPEPEKGFFYRSDHFEFAKQGVPALYTGSGTRYIDKPEGYGQQKRDEFTANDYHKPSDTVKPDWDLAGAVEDARLLFEVGFRVADGTAWPAWNDGTEFRAVREAMLERAAAAR